MEHVSLVTWDLISQTLELVDASHAVVVELGLLEEQYHPVNVLVGKNNTKRYEIDKYM